jgi:acid phosphatase (class A)
MRLRLLSCLVVLLAVCPIHADAAKPYTNAKGYLALTAPHAVLPDMLTPPPAEQSAIWLAEIDHIIAAQKNIDDTTLTAMRAEQPVVPEMVTNVLSEKFTRKNLPKTFHLLDRVGADTRSFTETAKIYWNTRRPFVVDTRVKLLIDNISNKAYPSGHTSISAVWAMTLAALMPTQTETLLKRADAIAWHRVQAGVHYQVDLTGGRELARLTFTALNANAQYKNDFERAQKELRQAGLVE